VHLSLGASRRRLIRQLVTESLALAATDRGCHRGRVGVSSCARANDGGERLGFQMTFALNPLVLSSYSPRPSRGCWYSVCCLAGDQD
jgi:hypothetical protein